MIVHARREARVEIDLHRVRRHRDDRHGLEAGIGAQRTRRRESVELRHLHVHQDGGIFRRRGIGHRDRFAAVASHVQVDPEASKKLGRDHLIGLVVLRQQGLHAVELTLERPIEATPRNVDANALRVHDRVEEGRRRHRFPEEDVDPEFGAACFLLLSGVGAHHDDG